MWCICAFERASEHVSVCVFMRTVKFYDTHCLMDPISVKADEGCSYYQFLLFVVSNTTINKNKNEIYLCRFMCRYSSCSMSSFVLSLKMNLSPFSSSSQLFVFSLFHVSFFLFFYFARFHEINETYVAAVATKKKRYTSGSGTT